MTLQHSPTTIFALFLLSFWSFPGQTGASFEVTYWKGAIVPFEIPENTPFGDREKTWIYDAIDEIMDKTCIQFRNKTSIDSNYIVFVEGLDCRASIGQKKEEEKQTIDLNEVCFKGPGIVVHELMHALGFFHEQARPDRDEFIRINNGTIVSNEHTGQYSINGTTDSIPYDFRSIMHYPPACPKKVGSCKPEEREFEPLDPDVDITKIGKYKGLSVLDAVRINKAYCPWYKPVSVEQMKGYKHSGPVGKEWKWEEQLY